MENASKALLMAAEILIGVLVLTLGMYLYISFSSTSKKIQEESSQNQINIFNAQFTSYQDQENLTIYDVITLANLAKEYNTSNNFETNDINYIKVKLTKKDGALGNIERYSETQMRGLIQGELNNINSTNTSLPQYTCTVNINKDTLKVDAVEFKFK